MKKVISLVIVSLFLFGSFCPPTLAVWIWDPRTGRWYNPKYEVKESSKLQYEHAENFEKKGKYERAAKEFGKLVKAYPTSPLAPEALVRQAQDYEKANFYYEAYKAYQMLIEKYPSYPEIQKIVEEEYRIGNLFLSGKKKKMKIIKLALFPSMEIAVEIFQKVVENFPYGDFADQAQLRIGLAYEKMKKYQEGVDAYKKLLKEFPKSTIRDEAKYRIGLCAYKESRGADYDQAATEKALEIFNEFLREYPTSPKADEVKAKIKELTSRKSQGIFQTASYYYKVGDYVSAKIYFKQVIEKFPDSDDAKIAKKRIQHINQYLKTEKQEKK